MERTSGQPSRWRLLRAGPRSCGWRRARRRARSRGCWRTRAGVDDGERMKGVKSSEEERKSRVIFEKTPLSLPRLLRPCSSPFFFFSAAAAPERCEGSLMMFVIVVVVFWCLHVFRGWGRRRAGCSLFFSQKLLCCCKTKKKLIPLISLFSLRCGKKDKTLVGDNQNVCVS